jgi:hypothetical protein
MEAIKAKVGDVLEVNQIGSQWKVSRILTTHEQVIFAEGVVNRPGNYGWRLIRDGVEVIN